MKDIIPAVEKELIIEELTAEKFLRKTNKGGNELYVVDYHNSPNILREIGRLREISFRTAGGGTGLKADIDEFDTCENPYQQLIVWDPDKQEILGGYRYFICTDKSCLVNGKVHLSTSEIFKFSDKFIDNYLPHMIELGRSFVQPQYQSTKAGSKGLFALDNLWDGIGAVWINNPQIKYFFGKVTMYEDYNREARDMILYFLDKHFGDKDELLTPLMPIVDFKTKADKFSHIFNGKDIKADQRILSQEVKKLGESIPPLINAYVNLSPTMKCFGTSINPHFGNVEETGIMVTAADFYESKTERHFVSYIQELTQKGIQILPGIHKEANK